MKLFSTSSRWNLVCINDWRQDVNGEDCFVWLSIWWGPLTRGASLFNFILAFEKEGAWDDNGDGVPVSGASGSSFKEPAADPEDICGHRFVPPIEGGG